MTPRSLRAPDSNRTSPRARCALLALLFVAVPSACSTGGAPGNDVITEGGLSADLHALSADSFDGRLVGTEGIERASDWIVARFEELGLEPAGDDGYRQRFDLAWSSLGPDNRLTVAGAGGARAPGRGWSPSSGGVTGSASGDVVFAGFGIVEPRLGFDDYQGERVDGKVVVVFDREPGLSDPSSPFDGLVTTEASRDWRKVLAAQQRGAAAVLIVPDRTDPGDDDAWVRTHRNAWPPERRRIERFTLSDWIGRITIPAAEISAELAERLVEGSGRTLDELAAEAEEAASGMGVVVLPGARVDLRVEIERHPTPGVNLLGMIEGADPTLRDEVVVIGAHHDHNGVDGDIVFNGADDDGSGTVGVMAVAAAYARAADRGERPRRSVLFAVWDAEERGLLGAWYYTLRPLFRLESTVANLNLDMIGRNEEVPSDGGGGRFRGLEPQTAASNANAMNLLGYSHAPELARAVVDANRFGLEIRLRYDNNESNLLRRSDHWPFLQSGVPAVWFHTGLHPDYHTPDDDPERIEYEKMTRIVKLVHEASWVLANQDGRPALDPMGSKPRS